jgi:hypothetical protein
MEEHGESYNVEMFFIKLATWKCHSVLPAKPSFFKAPYWVPIMR